jgi:spermidine synthase
MGKIILEFDSFEESVEARVALDAMKWKYVISDLDEELRKTTKYDVSILNQDETASEQEILIAEKYRERIREILHDNGLVLD